MRTTAVGPHLVIAGMMGVGKTTTAAALGARLDLVHRESDADIEAVFGRTGQQIAVTDGVDALHDLEAAMLLGSLAHPEPLVISAAGWVVEHEPCRVALARRAFTVVLEVPIDALIERIASGSHRRAISREELIDIQGRRRGWYDEIADLVLDAREPTEHLVSRIVDAVGSLPSG